MSSSILEELQETLQEEDDKSRMNLFLQTTDCHPATKSRPTRQVNLKYICLISYQEMLLSSCCVLHPVHLSCSSLEYKYVKVEKINDLSYQK